MALIYNGEELPCAAEVVDWHEHGLEFKPGMGHNRKRRHEPNLLVGHWTGGEGDERRIFNTLRRRGLGIHWTIPYDGVIYQHCDPALVAVAHAGRGNNSRSMGVELQNRGFPKRRADGRDRTKAPAVPTRASVVSAGRGKFPRGIYRDRLHGRRVSMCYFTVEQVEAWICLCDALTAADIIVPQVPKNSAGELIQRQLPPSKRKRFEGVVGHYHLSGKKYDPGTDLLNALILEEGY